MLEIMDSTVVMAMAMVYVQHQRVLNCVLGYVPSMALINSVCVSISSFLEIQGTCSRMFSIHLKPIMSPSTARIARFEHSSLRNLL